MPIPTRVSLARHPIAIAGSVLTTMTAVLFVLVFLLDLFGFHTNPYIGIVFFLIVPAFFLVGLLLIPLGMWIEHRRRQAGRPPSDWHWPTLDLNQARHRRTIFMVLVLTMTNVLIVSLAAYRGVEYMDSTSFCGQVCHTVMEPEFTAHQLGAHARVQCVRCHIGPGAPWFVRAKVDGMRQVIAVARDSYERPIPSPVSSLRPAREVCEQCHWPDKFDGERIKVIREYANDEQNTETVTQMQMHIGGGSERLGGATGIHWHMHTGNQIEYVTTDAKREVIPYVKLTDSSGRVREYVAEDATPAAIAAGERRVMDCIDCHNRPAHKFEPTPERAIDNAMAAGHISRQLPFVRREAVAAITAMYPDRDAGRAAIAERLRAFYQGKPVDGKMIDQAVAATQDVWSTNVFPRMQMSWGAHPNNVGHIDAPGCFRCHDDSHKAADGSVIRQDCELCHSLP